MQEDFKLIEPIHILQKTVSAHLDLELQLDMLDMEATISLKVIKTKLLKDYIMLDQFLLLLRFSMIFKIMFQEFTHRINAELQQMM
jgi:hypothetical protein